MLFSNETQLEIADRAIGYSDANNPARLRSVHIVDIRTFPFPSRLLSPINDARRRRCIQTLAKQIPTPAQFHKIVISVA